jgi:hypothetical protein
MPEVPATPRARWYVGGANVFLWDEATETWRPVTTPEEAPSTEAVQIFRTLLLELREKPFYEWRERGRRYRMER